MTFCIIQDFGDVKDILGENKKKKHLDTTQQL